MTLVVQSGGTPMKRPLKERPASEWRCSCPETHKPYLARCPRCREKRT